MKYKFSFFTFFFLSGYAALADQTIWTRLAMAKFGVTTVSISIVLSVFMLGLAIGSWLAAIASPQLEKKSASYALYCYAACEVLIGVGAFAAPAMFDIGRQFLLHSNATWGSAAYTVRSSLCIAIALLPWTICMGATFPFALAAVRKINPKTKTSFSYLYLANVLGATIGTVVTALVLIELLGFVQSLGISVIANLLSAIGAVILGKKLQAGTDTQELETEDIPVPVIDHAGTRNSALILLFITGLVGLALEVIWMRIYIPFLSTYTYAFAAVLTVYLTASYAGSFWYRYSLKDQDLSLPGSSWYWLALAAVGSLLFTDPRIVVSLGQPKLEALRILGIVPACFAMGFITPQLVDFWSQGDPKLAGKSYAINVLGSIAGPLVASFILLPWINERLAIGVIGIVICVSGIVIIGIRNQKTVALVSLCAVAILPLTLKTAYDQFRIDYPEARIVRDHTATTVVKGVGLRRTLLVNGRGMTELTPITKMMAHFPLTMREEKPEEVLVICFGAGTSHRSALSWDANVTSVELVPGVYRVFDFFFDDAGTVTKDDRTNMVVDDGRRFLERNTKKFDLILVDPPPPIRAVGSSLLYSKTFLKLMKNRLSEQGILAHWIPSNEDPVVDAAITKAVTEVFPHVRIFRSLGGYGLHILAADKPIDADLETMLARLPEKAQTDAAEWLEERSDYSTTEEMFREIWNYEIDPAEVLAVAPNIYALDDDRPVNEYFLLRWAGILNYLAIPKESIDKWRGYEYKGIRRGKQAALTTEEPSS